MEMALKSMTSALRVPRPAYGWTVLVKALAPTRVNGEPLAGDVAIMKP
jgi:hypothetical protein